MIAVIQRVSHASVTIDSNVNGEINTGFLVLLGITHLDNDEDIQWLGKKIVGLRVFNDDEGKMNLDLQSVKGDILLISQFTLHASTKKGNRPSFIEAAKPDIAIPMYEKMIRFLETELGKPIQTGIFGADMKVSLLNDGPVTIVIDSKIGFEGGRRMEEREDGGKEEREEGFKFMSLKVLSKLFYFLHPPLPPSSQKFAN
jgi:D-tyrosyl-tRNA(Tyr) deacylase